MKSIPEVPVSESSGQDTDSLRLTSIPAEDRKRRSSARLTAERNLQALLQASPLAVVTLDAECRVRLWNPAAERLFGWKAGEVAGQLCPFVADEHQPAFRQQFARVLAGESFPELETRYRRSDGAPVSVSVSLSPVTDEAGRADEVLLVIADITERSRAAEAGRQERELTEALRDTAAALTSTLDPQTVMRRILENVGRVVPHDAANIMQIEGSTARVTQMRGYPPHLETVFKTQRFSMDIPTFYRMLTSGQSCLIEDTHQHPHWITMFGANWTRSYIATPIRVYGHVVGFLNLDSQTPNAFTATDVERLQAFADQVAIAIENAQLYDAIRRDAAELKMLHRATAFLFNANLFTTSSLADVAYQVAEAVVKEFGQLDCGVMLLDDRRRRLIRLARAGDYGVQADTPLYLDGAGLVPDAMRSGEVTYAPDVSLDLRYVPSDPRTRSELVIPLKTGKGVIGALDLQSTLPDAFGAQERRMLKAFAERAAAAIENVLLYEEVRRYTVELEQRVSERTAELHRVKERVEAIVNHSSDAIAMVSDDGMIQQTNRALNEMFHYEEDAVFGKPLTVLACEDDAAVLRDALKEVVAANRALRVELTAVTQYGTAFEADVVLSPITEHDNRVSSVVCSLRDITTRKRIEAELRNALEREKELSDLKSRFISTASHEFRTPLAMIMTSSDLLKKYGDRMTEEQRTQRLDKIQSEVATINSLLDDLLTVSRANEVGRVEFSPAPLDVREVCEDIVREVETGVGMNHTLVFNAIGTCGTLVMDAKLLRRILFNLLSNAVKYSLSGKPIYFNLICEERFTIFQIRDEGIGVPDDDQKRLFEAFHRGRNVENISGTGLGLAIVKHAVELHGGTITFSSQLGVGTTFVVTIPKNEPREP